MKRVLITGSAGFIGSHLVDHILENTDWEIIGIDSFRHRGDSLRIYQDPKRYKIITHDLTSPISDRLIHKIGNIDFIVNMASESHVDRSITDPVSFCENNFKLVLTMLEYARKVKPEMFIQISTDEVYGPALHNTRHKEWSTILPSNPYSASKASQEALAISYWRTFKVPVVLTNTMNVFSPRQDSEKFIPMLIKNINSGKEVIIHGSEGDIGSRFYIHARNKADALLFILQKTTVKMYEDNIDSIIVPDRYNIVGEIELNNLQVAEIIADILQKPLYYKLEDFHKTRSGHDRRYALDGSKLKEMGWIPPMTFRESLEQTVKWTLENPEWMI